MITNFSINEYNCAASSNSIKQLLAATSGVNKVNVNTLASVISINYDENEITSEDLSKKLTEAGIKVTVEHRLVAQKILIDSNKQISKLIPKIISSLIICLVVAYFTGTYNWHWPLPYFLNQSIVSFIKLGLCLIILYLNLNIFIQGLKDFIKFKPSSYTLITIASIISLSTGIYFSVQQLSGKPSGNLFYLFFGFIITIYNILELFIHRAKVTSVIPILDLSKFFPINTTIIFNHTEIEIPINEVNEGDILLVRKGDRIPADGVITRGFSQIDESLISDSTIPVSKNLSARVYEATLNVGKDFEMRVTAVGNQTVFHKMVIRADNALSTSLANENKAIKNSFVINWIFIILAVIISIFWANQGKSIDFVISILVSLLTVMNSSSFINSISLIKQATITKAFSSQIIINDGSLINIAPKLDTLMLDKQTIIDEHIPKIIDVMVDQSLTASEFYYIVFNIIRSQNTLEAQAVKEYLKGINIKGVNSNEFRQVSAKGIRGSDTRYFAGPLDYIKNQGINIAPIEKDVHAMEHEGKAAMIVSSNRRILGIMTTRDIVRHNNYEAIPHLHDMGMKSILVTNESVERTEHTISQLQTDEYHALLNNETGGALITRKQSEGNVVGLVDTNEHLLKQANIAFNVCPKLTSEPNSNEVTIINDSMWPVINAVSLLRLASHKLRIINAFYYILCIIGFVISCGIISSLFAINPSPIISASYMLLASLIILGFSLTIYSFIGRNTNPVNILVTVDDLGNKDELQKACDACKVDDDTYVEGILSSSTILIRSDEDISDELLVDRLVGVGLQVIEIKR